jgi:hypothetical protein
MREVFQQSLSIVSKRIINPPTLKILAFSNSGRTAIILHQQTYLVAIKSEEYLLRKS